MTDKRIVVQRAVLAIGIALCAARVASASDTKLAQQDVPTRRIQNGDSYVPPASGIASPQAPSTGEALKAQVLQKLQSDFAKADVDHAGSITRAQADRAGLGLVSRHFDNIDTKRAGRVTFDQVREYLRGEGAQL
jgi:hypothetical protein